MLKGYERRLYGEIWIEQGRDGSLRGRARFSVDATSMEAMWRGCDGESEDEEKGWNGMEVMDGAVVGGRY